MAVNPSSGVYVTEIDLSQAISQASTTVGAIVITAKQGPIGSYKLITNSQQFLQLYGNPDSTVGFGHYAALAFLQEASQLYVVRAIGSGALYGGVMLQEMTATTSALYNDPQANPAAVNFATTLNGALENLAYFYAIGPGSYAQNVAVSITSLNLTAPANLTASAVASGGTLGASTRQYVVTASNTTGETVMSTSASVTLTGSNNGVLLSWNAVAQASAYNVYLQVGGTYELLTTVTTNTFTDTGALTPEATVNPPASYAGTPYFTVNVFDLTKNAVVPVEQWKCSLQNNTDGLGNQTELAQVLNASTGSNYINVVNNGTNLSSVPLVFSVGQQALSGGSSGAAVTDSTVINAMQLFANKEDVSINILIGGGWVSPAVQLAMDTLATTRQDTISVIDVPSADQTSQAAVAYRNNTLNLNSNYSALYTPDLYILDTYNNLQLYVPPSGYAAAIMARTDRLAQPWYAPAGLNRGLLNILGVRQVYQQGDRDALQQAQINYVRKFPGQGYAIMEAYTLQSKLSALSFIPVRRMLMVIETAVSKALLYSLWEPNDPILQQQITTIIGQYLDTIVATRGIKSYQVLCNTIDNPANTTANGTLVVQVYIIPVLPVARISLEMIIMGQQMSFTEAISAVNA